MKAFKRLFVTVFGLFAATAAMAEAKQAPLSFAGYEGETALVDFQVLVKLSEGQYGFSYNDYAAKDGSDLWFADSAGNVIPHEIDSRDASGNALEWVRAPEVTGAYSWACGTWASPPAANLNPTPQATASTPCRTRKATVWPR